MHIRGKAAVLLVNPKYPRNVGAVLRTCSAYGIDDLRYSGYRMDKALSELSRLPREERMKGYKDVTWGKDDRPFDEFVERRGYTPIAIEVRENAEMLHTFDHPENALYVFGPEDGGLTNVTLRHCHRFVAIPTLRCLNLATAVSTVLYDRHVKLNPDARLDVFETEQRGFVDTDPMFEDFVSTENRVPTSHVG